MNEKVNGKMGQQRQRERRRAQKCHVLQETQCPGLFPGALDDRCVGYSCSRHWLPRVGLRKIPSAILEKPVEQKEWMPAAEWGWADQSGGHWHRAMAVQLLLLNGAGPSSLPPADGDFDL